MADSIYSICNLGILDTLSENSILEIVESYEGFCAATETLLNGAGDLSVGPQLVSNAHSLCKHGLESLLRHHFLGALEKTFEKNGALRFWRHFEDVSIGEQVFYNALEEISLEKQYQEKCLLMLVHALQTYNQRGSHDSDAVSVDLFAKYQLSVSSVLMSTLPRQFPGT